MAKIVEIKLEFPVIDDPGIAGYRLYIAKQGNVLDYSSPHADIPISQIQGDTVQVRFPDDFPPDYVFEEGNYIAGITTYDAAGNEPDMQTKNEAGEDVVIPFDVTPPPMVPWLRIVTI